MQIRGNLRRLGGKGFELDRVERRDLGHLERGGVTARVFGRREAVADGFKATGDHQAVASRVELGVPGDLAGLEAGYAENLLRREVLVPLDGQALDRPLSGF